MTVKLLPKSSHICTIHKQININHVKSIKILMCIFKFFIRDKFMTLSFFQVSSARPSFKIEIKGKKQ